MSETITMTDEATPSTPTIVGSTRPRFEGVEPRPTNDVGFKRSSDDDEKAEAEEIAKPPEEIPPIVVAIETDAPVDPEPHAALVVADQGAKRTKILPHLEVDYTQWAGKFADYPRVDPNINLRSVQDEAIETYFSEQEKRRVIISLPTGTGKTVTGLAISGRINGRVLWIAHRDELIEQPAEEIKRLFPDLEFGIEKANKRDGVGKRIVISSIQTLSRKNRILPLLQGAPFSVVVYDECHHSTSVQAMRVLSWLGCFREDGKGPRLLGLTATIERSDKTSLGHVFEDVIYSLPIQEAIRLGFLVPPKPIKVYLPIPMRLKKGSDGDISISDADREARRLNVARANAMAIVAHCEKRKTIVFTTSVDQAKRTAEECQRLGVKAEWVSGQPYMNKKDRKAAIKRFAAAEIQVLVSAELLVEGFDDRSVGAVVIARPTLSQPRYCLDLDTEILGPNGWLKHNQVDVGDTVAGFDVVSGEIRWCKTTGKIERELYADEKFVTLQSPTVDMRVTDKHRMLYRNKRDKREGWQFIEASKLASRRSESFLPVAGVQRAPGVNVNDDDLRFIGWFLSDGTVNDDNGQVTISQSVESPFVAEIDRCLTACGFRYGRHVVKRTTTNLGKACDSIQWKVSRGMPLKREDRHLTGWARLESFIDKKFSSALEDIDQRQLGVLLEAMHCGDGNKQYFAEKAGWTPRSYHISTGDKVMADRIQSLCVRRGYRCNVATWTPPKDHPFSKNPIFVLHVKMEPEDRRMIGGIGYTDRPTIKTESGRPGERVWCVETETGTIVTRKSGKVLVLGNCQMAGRGLRTCEHKVDCLLLDIACSDHPLVTADILLKPPEEKIKRKTKRREEIPVDSNTEWKRLQSYLRSARIDTIEHGEIVFARASDDLIVTVAKDSQLVILRRSNKDGADLWMIEHGGLVYTMEPLTLQEAMSVCDALLPSFGGSVKPDSPEWGKATETPTPPPGFMPGTQSNETTQIVDPRAQLPLAMKFVTGSDPADLAEQVSSDLMNANSAVFARGLRLAFEKKACHLLALDKGTPPDRHKWGWTAQKTKVAVEADTKDANGPMIGWIYGDLVCVEPSLSVKLAEEALKAAGEKDVDIKTSYLRTHLGTVNRTFKDMRRDWIKVKTKDVEPMPEKAD